MIGKSIAQYKIIDRISGYGMGVVYKATDTLLNRTVVLKILPSELSQDPDRKQRFISEAQAAGSLDHPNICTIHEFGESEDGRLFMVMPYYQGETLKDRIEQGPIPFEETLGIVTQAAEGLAAAHREGFIHRDIKPANIMITQQGLVKLLDFGLVKQPDQDISQAADFLGTVAYMSPEQAMGTEVDHRTDLWSLGVTIYEMLTGKHPFHQLHRSALLYAIINEPPEFTPQLFPAVPGWFVDLLQQLLAKDPEQRPEDAEAVISRLRRSQAAPESITDQQTPAAKIFWKKYSGLIAAAVILLILILGNYASQVSRRQAGSPGNDMEQLSNPTIAVLPLVNLSRDPEQSYFVDGLTEELITDLAKFDSLRVISRTSAMRYKHSEKSLAEIARELRADYIVEGSVLTAGEQVRVTAQLIHAAADQHVWAESYEREVRDVLSLQRDVALSIANEVHITLTAADEVRLNSFTSVNPEAYDAYLLARYALNRFTVQGWQNAIVHYQDAIRAYPEYAEAYAELAYAYFFLTIFQVIPRDAGLQQLTDALEKSLSSDQDAYMAYVVQGLKSQFFEFNWNRSKNAFLRALELSPGSSEALREYGWLLARTGQLDEALTTMRRVLELDPYSVQSLHSLSQVFYYQRQYDQAIRYAQMAAELDPAVPLVYDDLGWAYLGAGHSDQAIEMFQKKAELLNLPVSADIGYVYAVTGRGEEDARIAHQLHELLPSGRSSYHEIGRIYLGLGDTDRALDYFEHSFQQGESYLVLLKIAPWLEAVRSHPRFQALLKKTGLLDGVVS